MKKNILAAALCASALTNAAIDNAWARPEYVIPTGASGCTDCHYDNSGSGFRPGVLDAAASPLGIIAGLTAFLHPDTAPVLSPINGKWDITVGEQALVIPLRVFDAENDTFVIKGSAPAGSSLSSVYIDAATKLPTVNFKWAPTAAQAGKIFPLKVYAQETGTGRTLASNTVSANIQVWAARTSATKNVGQFSLLSAQWKNNTLTLTGSLAFKSTVTAAQRTAALSTLQMNLYSASGKSVTSPAKLSPLANGTWTKTFSLTSTQVPCWIRVNYEGLNAARSVNLAPVATCLK